MIPWRQLSFGRKFTAPYYARYFFLRMLPFPDVRRIGAWFIGRSVRLRKQGSSTSVQDREVVSAVKELDERGFLPVQPVLNSKQIEEMRVYLARQPAYDGKRELLANAETRDALRARYPMRTIVECPHALAAINNPQVLKIAEGFLGCKPTIAAVGLHWSYPSSRSPEDVQRFHRDTEAWSLLNMFVYLTDVDEGGGPHRYVLGSHRTRGRLRLAPYSEAHVRERYDSKNVHTVVGPRGTTFVENGWGIHEGQPPSDKPRLMLSVMYSVGPIPVYDYPAVRVRGSHDYDRYVNRLVIADAASAAAVS
jgi:hypothetical protein